MTATPYYQRYIDLYEGSNLTAEMVMQGDLALEFYKGIGDRYQDYRYSEGKWTIREVLAHVIDAERVFAYRALRFARGDSTELPGFDENSYAREMNIENRPFYQLINEFANVRAASTDLFNSFHSDMLQREGKASGEVFRVETIGKILVGHEIHHRGIIETRYIQ